MRVKKNKVVIFFFFFCLISILPTTTGSPDLITNLNPPFRYTPPGGGAWALLQPTIGLSAMHMQLLHDDTVVIFDRTSSNNFPPVHSILYDVASNTLRPLTVKTDTFCSSGSVDPNGTLVQTGGYSAGERVVRTFSPSSPDWTELPLPLSSRRWYSSNHLLPDGRIIILGGRNSPSYEFFPPSGLFRLPFLLHSSDGRNNENNLYPFLHLLPDGNLFLFANNRSISFDYRTNHILRRFPPMPGPDRRCYPSTGSSILLPVNLSKQTPDLEVLICGGAPAGAYYLADGEKLFLEASRTCGRMKITASRPRWVMEEMPTPRVMGDMILLPTGDVLILNGAANGTAGWDNADNPVLHPVLYRPYEPRLDRRFSVMSPTTIPRMYHSSAVLVADGRVLVAGSNPNPEYSFTGTRFPTELSMEAFSPPYLDPVHALVRPSIVTVESPGAGLGYGEVFSVNYDLMESSGEVAVMLLFPPFTTHSYGMNQRMVVPRVESVVQLSVRTYKVTVRAPWSVNVAPPGYYLLFVVHAQIPSRGVWLKLVADGVNHNVASLPS